MVVYQEPKDSENYIRWSYGGTVYDIWYKDDDVVYLGRNYRDKSIDAELIGALEECKEIIKNKKDFPDYYPVKYAEIGFIYKDKVYVLLPDALDIVDEFDFEVCQTMIRRKLGEIGVEHSKYEGMLD